MQTLALRRVVVPVASQLGLKEQYAYLETSIAEFPTGLSRSSWRWQLVSAGRSIAPWLGLDGLAGAALLSATS